MVLDAFFQPAAKIFCNVPALLGALDELVSDFSEPSNQRGFLGTQHWRSPLRKCFCMEGQAEMLQSTVHVAQQKDCHCHTAPSRISSAKEVEYDDRSCQADSTTFSHTCGLQFGRQDGSHWTGKDLLLAKFVARAPPLCARSRSRWLDGGLEIPQARVQERKCQKGFIARAESAGAMPAPKCGDGVLLDSSKSARVGHGVVGHDLASVCRGKANIHQRLRPHIARGCSNFAFLAAALGPAWRHQALKRLPEL